MLSHSGKRVLGASVASRESSNQAILIFKALIKSRDLNALILAVSAHVIEVGRKPGMAIGRNAGIAQIGAVCRTRAHEGHHRKARPHLLRHLFYRAEDLLVE